VASAGGLNASDQHLSQVHSGLSDNGLAINPRLRQTRLMNNPWKWIALALGVALIVLAIFTILVVNGVMDFGFSVL